MTNKELAELMYPNTTKTIEDYEKMFPERNLSEGAIVTRFAPSPTGFVHMGSLLTTFVGRKVTEETNGVFYLRIEDTDQKRSVENGVKGIIDDLNNLDIHFDEGATSEDEYNGEYGPYIQTKRKEIYETFAKYMVENDLAYPCFCDSEQIEEIKEMQEHKKARLGYYGKYARCRSLSNEEKAEKIKNGTPYVLRLKSNGDFDNKCVVNDLVRGKVEYPENDIDHVLIKSDGIPVYHFAHVVDDYLMRTTHVLRGEEWMPSTPLHLQIFKMLGIKAPKYAHLGLVMKMDEDGSRRKLSKRKDPEAAVSYYVELGIPTDAVKLYLMTIANSNFESFLQANPDATIKDFKFDFKKMSVSGSLYDIDKLMNISKNYISRLKASDVYNNLYNWAKEYDKEFAKLIEENKEYTINILNIEREQKKPRKDFASYSEIKSFIWYMFKSLFNDAERTYEWQEINNIQEIKNILNTYMDKYYDINDDKDTWFNKMKELCDELGYASNVKEYKEDPSKFKGSIVDVSMVVRVALTTKSMTPDLYEIMKLLGVEEIKNRINMI